MILNFICQIHSKLKQLYKFSFHHYFMPSLLHNSPLTIPCQSLCHHFTHISHSKTVLFPLSHLLCVEVLLSYYIKYYFLHLHTFQMTLFIIFSSISNCRIFKLSCNLTAFPKCNATCEFICHAAYSTFWIIKVLNKTSCTNKLRNISLCNSVHLFTNFCDRQCSFLR